MLGTVIEEYLVRLGVDLDKKALNEMHRAQADINSAMSAMTKYAPSVAKAGALITATLTGIIGTGAALVKSVAEQEMAYDTLGRTMFVTTAQAKSMKTALDALGKSVAEVQVNPRLRAQYQRLLADNNAMMPGGDYKAVMAETQDFLFELTRLKQEISVGMQWISYYIVKDLAGPLGDAKKTLRDINNYIIQNMPRITRTVATGFGYIRNIAWAVLRVLGGIGKKIGEVWDAIPAGGKKAILALSVILAAFAAGPVGQVAMAMSGLLILIDDYFAYADGRDNAFGEYWEELQSVMEDAGVAWREILDYLRAFFIWMENSKDIDRFVRLLKAAWKAFKELGIVLTSLVLDGLSDLRDYLKNTGTVSDFTGALHTLYLGIMDLVDGGVAAMRSISGLLKVMRGNPHVLKFWTSVKRIFNAILQVLIKSISNLGRFASIIGKLLKGDLSGAKKVIGSIETIFDRDGAGVALNSKELGGLSHKYEAGSPGTIGAGSGGSYGSWQIVAGNIPTFLEDYLAQSNPEYYDRLKSAGPVGSRAFNDEWRAIAAEDPEGFEAAQHRYIADTHYGEQAAKIKEDTGLDISQMSRGVREAVWSTAVQHGPGTNIVTRAIDRLGGAEKIDLSEESQKALIDALYDIRMGYSANDEGVDESNLWDRWNRERADAKAIIEKEYEIKAKTGGSFGEPDDDAKPQGKSGGIPIMPKEPAIPAAGILPGNESDVMGSIKDEFSKWLNWNRAAAKVSATPEYGGNSNQSVMANVVINAYGAKATPEEIGRVAKKKIESILPQRNIARSYNRGAGLQ